MGAPDAQEIEDVVSCPGTDSCKLGITSSMGLNRAVQERVRSMAIDDPLTRKMRIHMSGCPNSCGQHHIADIGFHGAAIKVGNRQIPAYHMFVAGTYRTEEMRLGTLVPKVRIPAKRVPDAVERVIDLYHSDREDDQELFSSWVDRVGLSPIQDTLNDLTLPPEFSADTLADVHRLGPPGHLHPPTRRRRVRGLARLYPSPSLTPPLGGVLLLLIPSPSGEGFSL